MLRVRAAVPLIGVRMAGRARLLEVSITRISGRDTGGGAARSTGHPVPGNPRHENESGGRSCPAGFERLSDLQAARRGVEHLSDLSAAKRGVEHPSDLQLARRGVTP